MSQLFNKPVYFSAIYIHLEKTSKASAHTTCYFAELLLLIISLLPMAAWLVTIYCMTRYSLSGKKMQEVQAVNAVRKAAVQGGMKMEDAMATWQTIDQVPERFVHPIRETGKPTILDKLYERFFTKTETVKGVPSANAVEIPEQYRK